MSVQFIDFSKQYEAIKDNIDIGLKKVFVKGDFILGEATRNFESDFAKFCGSKFGIGVNSGTDALFLALKALNIKPGDEVILPSFTFIASSLCISYNGATPVFVDVEDKTYNMDPEKLEAAITDKTKAIIVVHIYGQPANMNEINEIAKKHNIRVIEDAAQAHGSSYKGKRVGSLADMACFSFYPTKGLGGYGDGGMVVTASEEYDAAVRMLRDYGRSNRYDHKIIGYNSRLDTLQAVILGEKLKFLDQWNKMRTEAGKYYNEILKSVDGVGIPIIKEDREHVFQTYAVRLKNRDVICDKFKERGIGVLIHYPIPVHLQEAYKSAGYKKGDFPVSEALANEVLSLPMYPHIEKQTIEFVCDNLKDILKKL